MTSVTHYKSSKGFIAIADMNEHHLHNAIKKLAAANGPDRQVLEALKAEQERRGGPPKE